MPFNRIDTQLSPTINQTSLYDFIKARFAALTGYTVFDEFTSGGNRNVIYEIVLDNTKLAGKVYLQIKVTTALAVTQILYTAWNTATDTGSAASTETTAVTFASNIAIDSVNLSKDTEGRFVVLSQGTTIAFLGILRPTNKPTAWNEDSFPFAFIQKNDWAAPWSIWFGALSSPYGTTAALNTYTTLLNDARMATQNPINNRRDILAGIVLFSPTQGIAGRTSDELVIIAASGLARFDPVQVTPGTEEYLLLNGGAGSLGVRTI